MKSNHIKAMPGYIALAVTVAISVFLLTAFTVFPNDAITLSETSTENPKWNYTVLTGTDAKSTVLESCNGYSATLKDENFSALCMTQKMPSLDVNEEQYLDMYTNGIATEVFIDNFLIYSNIDSSNKNIARMDNSFLNITSLDGYIGTETTGEIRVPLSNFDDNSQIKIYFYYSDEMPFYGITYPSIGNMFQMDAIFIIGTIEPIAVSIIGFLIAIGLCIIFISKIRSGNADYKLLLLILFFVLFSLNKIIYYSSTISNSSVLFASNDFSILNTLYIFPLLYFIALSYRKPLKYIILSLSTVISVLIIFESIMTEIEIPKIFNYDSLLFIYLLISIIVFVINIICDKEKVRSYKKTSVIIITAIILLCSFVISARLSDSILNNYLSDIIVSLMLYNVAPINTFLYTFIVLMSVYFSVMDFSVKYSEYKKKIYVLSEREKYAMQNYKMMKSNEEETRALRHEMQHHMNAIEALLSNGEIKRTKEYVDNVTEQLHKIPKINYCKNFLINAITNAYAERAKNNGIEFECNALTGESINIADADLCVFLENMYENALDAVTKIKDKKRFIKVNIRENGNFLFISCSNSCYEDVTFDENHIPVTDKPDKKNHGYGITAMKSITEKYNSILMIDCSNNVFSVETNMNTKSKKVR